MYFQEGTYKLYTFYLPVLYHRKVLWLSYDIKTLRGMHTMRRGKLLKQLRIGAQSVQAPHEWGVWGVEVGLPTLFYKKFFEFFVEQNFPGVVVP